MTITFRRIALLACAMLVPTSMAHPVASQVAAPPRAPIACESIASVAGPDTRITGVERIAPGAFKMTAPPAVPVPHDFSKMPAFCRVTATVSPVAESEIKMELWMPLTGWNGKFVGVGNGGFSGAIWYFQMIEPLERGYAVVATNGGHDGGQADARFATNPEAVIDYAWRAVHEMTVKGKAIVAAHYGREARHAYFIGCSTGGRQGLKEAQRFPNDYDGIVSGAPAHNWVPLLTWATYAQKVATDPAVAFTPPHLELLKEAAIAKCDKGDGVTDRVAEDPRRCTFDPGQLLCKEGGDPSKCLTARQVEAARSFYAGVVNPRTGAKIYPGPAPGGETAWFAFRNGVFPIGQNYYRHIVMGDPAWNVTSFDVDRDVARAIEKDKAVGFTTSSTDLKGFFARGGKLLLWHGWTDGLIPAQSTIDYYEAVRTANGAAATAGARLFMLPGVDHCTGGEGPDVFDELTAIDTWVDGGKAPERLIARRAADGPTPARTRPLCPYPQVARYRGQGSTDDERSFVCGVK
jgi:feruloyl esterase